MAHGLTKVDGNEPTREGDISLSLSSVLDEASPVAGDTPTYSTSWGAVEFNPQTRVLYYQKHIALTNTGTTGGSYQNNDYFVWRTETTVQPDEFINSTGVTLSAAQNSTSPFTSNGTFKQSVTLSESGTYLFIFMPAFGNTFASNDSLDIRMSDGASFGQRLHVSTEGKFGDCLFAIRTITTSKTFRFVVSNISGTVDVMESIERNFFALSIYKIKE